MMRRVRANDEGSILLAVLITMICTGLILAVVVSTDAGMKQSDRAGDSANALQLADAGVNEAVKRAATEPITVTSFSDTKTLTGAGSYVFTATRDSASPTNWHIYAEGTDSTGEKRKIRAQATPEPIFANALFGAASLTLASGVSVDSYASATARCTGKGFAGSNNATGWDQGGNGGGGGVINCQHDPSGDGAGYPYDGCISYGDGVAAEAPDIPAGANCPPGNIRKDSNPFPMPIVQPTGTFVSQPAGTCNTGDNQTIAAGTYRWTSLTLRHGCQVTGGTAIIYVSGAVQIGSNGSNDRINAPAGCTGSNQNEMPNGASCWTPRRPATLQIWATTGSSGTFCYDGNNTAVWATMVGPTRTFSKCGGGGSHLEIWGAMLFNSISTSAQFALHYDESLTDISSGRYVTRNWREAVS
jgi:hypothetical protein